MTSSTENYLKPFTVLVSRPGYLSDYFGLPTVLIHIDEVNEAEAKSTARVKARNADCFHPDDVADIDPLDYTVVAICEGHREAIQV